MNQRTRSHVANLDNVILQDREAVSIARSAGMINTQLI
jgi:hypothetical protein